MKCRHLPTNVVTSSQTDNNLKHCCLFEFLDKLNYDDLIKDLKVADKTP